MLISLNWIKEYVDYELDRSPAKLAETVSLAVAEVEDYIEQGGALAQVKVVEVLDTKPHPSADRLKIATINDGNEEREIVCGAPNCRPGLRAPFADVGTKLPTQDEDGKAAIFEIKKAKIRGVESCGMLCSAAELSVPGGHEGLLELAADSPIGTTLSELADFANAADLQLEIDNKSLTHRPDLWGHYGFAREFSAMFDLRLTPYPQLEPESPTASPFSIRNEAPDVCPRYTGLMVRNVTVGPSPSWLSDRLQALGQNSINNIVDITNYILLELGQPMHAFDVAKLNGREVVIRTAQPGESFAALDGETYTLEGSDIVIDDAGRAVALAGIMGGEETGIDESAVDIFLESANFAAATVRRTSNRLGLRSESSARFEKSLDPNHCPMALKRAWQLIHELCPGAYVEGSIVDDYPTQQSAIAIDTSYEFIQKRLGKAVPTEFIANRLEKLGFGLSGDLQIQVPSWRATKDVSIPEDIVEEVGRLYGYDNIEPSAPRFPISVPEMNADRLMERHLKALLTEGYGLSEVFTYPWVSAEVLTAFGLASDSAMRLTNGQTQDQSLMRPSVVPQIVKAIAENLKHSDGVRLFEYGRVYDTNEMDGLLPTERKRLVGALVPPKGDGLQASAFYEAKRLVQDILQIGGISNAKAAPLSGDLASWVHNGVAAGFYRGRQCLAQLYKLHPKTAADSSIRHNAYLFEVDIDVLSQSKRNIRYTPISKYPKVYFEVTVLADERVPSADIEAVIGRQGKKRVVDISVLAIYQGPEIPSGQKAMSYRIAFGSAEGTLGSEEVATLQDGIVDALIKAGYPLKS